MKKIFALALTVAFAIGFSVPSHAAGTNLAEALQQVDLSQYPLTADSEANGSRLVNLLLNAPDPDALTSTLTDRDLADIRYTTTIGSSTIEVTNPVQVVARTRAVVSPVCWTSTTVSTTYAATGQVMYQWQLQGYWCTLGSNIVSSQTLSTAVLYRAPFFSADSVLDLGNAIISNQARFWAQRQFTFGLGSLNIVSGTPCLRLVGAYDGHSWSSQACGAI